MRLVLLHGFTQTGSMWAPMVAHLRPRAATEVITPDLPGHGVHGDVVADLDEAARLMGSIGGRAVYVGYSLGGRVLLHLALARPDLVERLVLVGATAGIDDDAERAARRTADERLADRIEAIGVQAFLAEWLAQPIFATLPPDRAAVVDRTTNTAAGLASSLRHAGTGTQTPRWHELGRLTMPTLVVAGALDEKFTALGRRMAAAMPDATFATVAGAGHSVPLEQPAALAAVVDAWLDQPPSARPTANAAP